MRVTTASSFGNHDKGYKINEIKASKAMELPFPIIYCGNLGLLGSNRSSTRTSMRLESKNLDDTRKSISAMNNSYNKVS